MSSGRGVGGALNYMFKGVIPATHLVNQPLPLATMEASLAVGRKKKAAESCSKDVAAAKKGFPHSLEAVKKAKSPRAAVDKRAREEIKEEATSELKRKRAETTVTLARKPAKRKRYTDLFEASFSDSS